MVFSLNKRNQRKGCFHDPFNEEHTLELHKHLFEGATEMYRCTNCKKRAIQKSTQMIWWQHQFDFRPKLYIGEVKYVLK